MCCVLHALAKETRNSPYFQRNRSCNGCATMSLKALAEKVILRNQRCNKPNNTPVQSGRNDATPVATNITSVIKPLWISSDEREVVAWLESIGETDPVVLQETLDKCRASEDALAFFLDLARNITVMVI